MFTSISSSNYNFLNLESVANMIQTIYDFMYNLKYFLGFEMNFYSGVFGTAIGQTNALGKQSFSFVGLVGVMIGIGELTSNNVLFTI